VRLQPDLFQGLIGRNGQIITEALEEAMRDPNRKKFIREMIERAEAERAVTNSSLNGISITAEESRSIERLQECGFTRQQVMEAFLVCGKNVQMAANYLYDNEAENSFVVPTPVTADNINLMLQAAETPSVPSAREAISSQVSFSVRNVSVDHEGRSNEADDSSDTVSVNPDINSI